MTNPIEVKVFVEKMSDDAQPQKGKEFYRVYWLDAEWNKYTIESYLWCAWDARGTVAMKEKN